VVEHERAVFLAAVHDFCDGLAARDRRVNEVEEGGVRFCEVGGEGGPVVHFRVDVYRVFGLPGGAVCCVPYSLEVCGEGLGACVAGGGGEEVAAVVEEESYEFGVCGRVLLEGCETGVGGLGACGARGT